MNLYMCGGLHEWLSNIKCKASVAAASCERHCRRDGDHPKTLSFTNHSAIDKLLAHKERRALSNVLALRVAVEHKV